MLYLYNRSRGYKSLFGMIVDCKLWLLTSLSEFGDNQKLDEYHLIKAIVFLFAKTQFSWKTTNTFSSTMRKKVIISCKNKHGRILALDFIKRYHKAFQRLHIIAIISKTCYTGLHICIWRIFFLCSEKIPFQLMRLWNTGAACNSI